MKLILNTLLYFGAVFLVIHALDILIDAFVTIFRKLY